MSGSDKSFLVLCFAVLLMCFGSCCLAAGADGQGGVQPYQDPRFVAIPQGVTQCGPACFYMIFNFYGAHQRFKECDLSGHPERDTANHGRISRDTAVCKWINSGRFTGTSFSQLKRAADGLHAPGESQPYFLSEACEETTEHGVSEDEAKRERILMDIKKRYLDRNRPVIIHLRRVWYLPGHYLVLTGYDPKKEKVYYADPNRGTTGSIDRNSFISEKWYVSPSNTADYYRARWDGEWFGFYVREPGQRKQGT
ncbi:MAG TPA: C39 family peptidase [Deltaproteobacteria bacterium]|jgi:hypothetical protein|nr:C39 family peptidase [Deltaproteobacteria bacterium]HOI06505.1 C39 family peptidase [Deltaproteobacteria bacterium]